MYRKSIKTAIAVAAAIEVDQQQPVPTFTMGLTRTPNRELQEFSDRVATMLMMGMIEQNHRKILSTGAHKPNE